MPLKEPAMNSDFNFRNPLKAKNNILSEAFKRIGKIAADNFSPLKGKGSENLVEAVTLDPTEREIFLYTVNHHGIYRGRITPIIDNYKKKISGGKFDRNLATKGFTYAVEDGIKEYNKENGTTIKMNPASRMRVAEKMLEYYGEEIGMAARNVSVHKEDVADEIKLSEMSPPAGPARRFSKKPEVKKSFKQRYGDRWKEVMYATAWKMHNK